MCGIICRMMDDNLDDTLPTLVSSGLKKSAPPEEGSLDITQPAAAQKAEESPDNPAPEPGSVPPTTGEPGDAEPPPPEGKKRRRRVLVPLAGVIVLLMIAVLSGMGGYRSGIGIRTDAEATVLSQQAREQYELGLQDLEMGFFERARQRFEYVIRLDPSYPGAADKLAEVLLEINTTATPTLVPTPTLTPTPDTRGIDGLFETAGQQMANADWDGAYDSLLRLRKQDPTYRAVDIDGMLFLVLRNRGMDKIAMQADLEGGLYDLALAARFGPLDNEAQGYMNWTTLYLTGASFWDLDWRQVVYYFEQIAPQLPYLKDGSGLTAIERYRLGLVGLGNTLMREGDACAAVEKYELALTYGADPEVDLALVEAVKACSGGGEATSQVTTPNAPVPPAIETPQPPPVVTDTPPGPPPVEPTIDPNITPTP